MKIVTDFQTYVHFKKISGRCLIPGQQAQQQQQGAFSSIWRRDPLTLFPVG